MASHLTTLEEADDPRTELAFSDLEQAIGQLLCGIVREGRIHGSGFDGHAKGTVAWKLLGNALVIFGPVRRADHTFRKDLGDCRPVSLVVECINVVRLGAQRAFCREVGGAATVKRRLGYST